MGICCAGGNRAVVIQSFGEGGRGLGRSEDLVPAATGWQSWFRSRAMVLAFTGLELRDPCWDRVHLAVFPVILSWV